MRLSVDPSTLEVANVSLQQHLQSPINNLKRIGIRTRKEARQAKLGEPISLFSAMPDGIFQSEGKSKPQTLLADPNTVLYPILIEGKARSVIGLLKDKETWHCSWLGTPDFARRLWRAKAVCEAGGISPNDVFAVSLAWAHYDFVGFEKQSKRRGLKTLYFVPADRFSKREFGRKPVRASQVFVALHEQIVQQRDWSRFGEAIVDLRKIAAAEVEAKHSESVRATLVKELRQRKSIVRPISESETNAHTAPPLIVDAGQEISDDQILSSVFNEDAVRWLGCNTCVPQNLWHKILLAAQNALTLPIDRCRLHCCV